MESDRFPTRRDAIKGIVTVSTTMVGTASAKSKNGSELDPQEHIKKLIEKHGTLRIGRGYFLNDEDEVIVDTTGKRYSAFDQDYEMDMVKFHQHLHFEDEYSTRTETILKFDEKQELSAMSVNDSHSPSGSATLINKVDGEKYQKDFSLNEFERKTSEKEEEYIANEGPTQDSSPISLNSGSWHIGTSDDGTEDLDQGIPVINTVGANYKTSDNRCGVAQQSTYLTVDASATAEVYEEKSVDEDISNATIKYDGSIMGVISTVGMGGSVTAEGFIRDDSGEESTLLMDVDTGIAEIPYLTNSGDVDEEFGPNDGVIGDKSYLDYEMTTDIESGDIEIGVRMEVAFNGLKGGITQTNFMPAERFYQPEDLGTRYSSIRVDY
ncbi:hypothetical protein [Natrinema ejinorense]|uniref:hypothetical protein n=1 Tax=Natrinema ejinorense TaxID=373386 RepID=UPI00117F4ED5|nr:hypothetical protein [Natrinema ejinorense]